MPIVYEKLYFFFEGPSCTTHLGSFLQCVQSTSPLMYSGHSLKHSSRDAMPDLEMLCGKDASFTDGSEPALTI